MLLCVTWRPNSCPLKNNECMMPLNRGLVFRHKPQFKVKNILMMDFFLTNTQLLALHDVNWWTGVVWIIVMFLSVVWTLILTAPIHRRASIGEQMMQCYIYPNLMKKQTYQRLGWPCRGYIFSQFACLGELFLLSYKSYCDPLKWIRFQFIRFC